MKSTISQFKVSEIIKSYLVPSANYIYGFADLTGLLPSKFKAYSHGISIGRRLDNSIVDGIKHAPTLEYLNHYSEINKELLNVCERISFELEAEGILAFPVRPTVTTDPGELDTAMPDLRYEISHKMVATRAGLGWIGKTDLFISKKFGARLRLSSILVDEGLVSDSKPIDKSRCGKCRICADKCPAGAANGKLWDIRTDRDVFFDAFKCREQCSKFGRSLLKIDRRICGICVAVCPIGQTKSSPAS